MHICTITNNFFSVTGPCLELAPNAPQSGGARTAPVLSDQLQHTTFEMTADVLFLSL